MQFVNGMNTSYVQIRNELASEQLIKVQFQVAMSERYTRIPPLSFYYMEQSTANSNSFKIAQKTAFEAKGRLYTSGKVIQRLFIIDLYT